MAVPCLPSFFNFDSKKVEIPAIDLDFSIEAIAFASDGICWQIPDQSDEPYAHCVN